MTLTCPALRSLNFLDAITVIDPNFQSPLQSSTATIFSTTASHAYTRTILSDPIDLAGTGQPWQGDDGLMGHGTGRS